MAHIQPITETAETVTLSRADFERLVASAEDAIDRAALRQQEAREAAEGVETARADYLPANLVKRLLAGESPIRVWREHRGMSGRALAAAAGVNAVYLGEIERGQKPGSAAAIIAVARVLGVEPAELVD